MSTSRKTRRSTSGSVRRTSNRTGGATEMGGAIDWASSRIGSVVGRLAELAETATELSMGGAQLLTRDPKHRKALERAGTLIREAREAAGLTAAELGKALDLKDPSVVRLVESGRAGLPVEALLRVAAVVARNDPVPFAMKLARSYSPELWRTLDQLGMGRAVAHAGREREIVNIYRSRDAARKLTDAEFAHVLAFTEAAFDMALGLAAETKARRR